MKCIVSILTYLILSFTLSSFSDDKNDVKVVTVSVKASLDSEFTVSINEDTPMIGSREFKYDFIYSGVSGFNVTVKCDNDKNDMMMQIYVDGKRMCGYSGLSRIRTGQLFPY